METKGGFAMIEVLSTNIISPLGMTTRQNCQAVKAGKSALMRYDSFEGIPEPVTASVISEADCRRLAVPGFTKFESIVIRSVQSATNEANIDCRSSRTVFILSTTKANVAELENGTGGTYSAPGESAAKIAGYLGITTEPVVVCNACISGASAQLLAKRLIESGEYDNAIVCGADCVTKFALAGFLSFKSLSPYECRPFDIERLGLNLGEAAATIVFGRADLANTSSWKLCNAGQTNDAYHISAPSPNGDGVLRAIRLALGDFPKERLACINVHGTATMFNDQMESKAVQNAGLSDIPLVALKGYYGHTLGASGILEAIITMESLNDGLIPSARGFDEIGVGGKVTISSKAEDCPDARAFLKIISGFGGCNGALLYSKDNLNGKEYESIPVGTIREVHINSRSFSIDGVPQTINTAGKGLLSELYKTCIDDYPKFHKMDVLSKLAFIGAHFILKDMEPEQLPSLPVLLFNGTSSIVSDKKHIGTYSQPESFFPSPSVFIYTLPNIAVGELAIRYGITAETGLYILPGKNGDVMERILKTSCGKGEKVLAGWVDCRSENEFDADFKLLTYK